MVCVVRPEHAGSGSARIGWDRPSWYLDLARFFRWEFQIHSFHSSSPEKRSAKDSDVGKSKVTSWTTRTNERRDCKRQFAPNQQPAAVNCPTGRMRVGLAGFESRPRSRSRRFRFQMQLTRFLIESFLVQGGDGDGDSEERACETSPMESPCRTAEARTRGGRTGCRRGQREKEEGVGSFGSFVAGFQRGGCEEGEAERAVRGIGKRKGMDGKVRYVGYVYP